MAVDLARPYALHPRVALRPEPFGALAYHYDNRRLTFLKSPELVRLLYDLERHATLKDALDAHSSAPKRRRLLERALVSLERSEVIGAR